jgi:hypothetical protein
VLYAFETNESWSSIIKSYSNETCYKWLKRKGKKVELFLSTPWRHMGEVKLQLHFFFTSALDGDELSRSRSGFFISGKEPLIPEDCALLGYYAASSGIFLPTFRDNLTVPSSRDHDPWSSWRWNRLTPKDRTDRLSRNVSKKLPLFTA